MNNYKCIQCGLVNWTSQEFCKRCQLPNPYLNQPMQTVEFSQNATQANFSAQPMPPVRAMPDYSVPPPPNVFGTSAGTATTEAFSQFPQTAFANRPPIRATYEPVYSPEDLENLRTAEKQIRNAWICGVVICALSLLFAIIFSAVSSSKAELPATPFEILISVVLFGGLTIGVYFKSRACAILLCVLFIVDKIITWAYTGKMSGAMLAFVFIYYFAYGIQGTFTYRRLKKQMV